MIVNPSQTDIKKHLQKLAWCKQPFT
jgi:hypothetical protein